MYNNVYKGKTVLVTGHTGFKGSWLSIWLTMMGAKVVGYSLDPSSDKGNFEACHLHDKLFADVRGDTRDLEHLDAVVKKYQPEIVFHLAAQALVRTSYEQPKETFETNIMGSLNIMECMRNNDCLKTAIMITSDKCYENVEQIWGYKETDRMGGEDPYSASKGCTELMLHAYRQSYFNPAKFNVHGKAVAIVRAGNVIGGGDWSDNRLIPDCIRFIEAGKPIVVRRLVEYYGKGEVVDASDPNAVHENTLLNLDVTKAYVMLQWEAKWGLTDAVQKTVDWYKEALHSNDMYDFCVKQIEEHGEHLV